MIAALFVAERGCYTGLPGVDAWTEARDARLYAGPHPVVAHPPCARWSRLAQERIGEDEGCFASALASVRTWGGILEHPEGSRAFRAHGMLEPERGRGWMPAGDFRGWVCCVEQGHYGHRARKATWLYACGVDLPSLIWTPSVAKIEHRPGRDYERERRTGAVQRMCHRERLATPIAFRDLLLSIARTAQKVSAA